jgi:hypothetical protein
VGPQLSMTSIQLFVVQLIGRTTRITKMYVLSQQMPRPDALDTLASSSDLQNLSNNKVCCLQKKSVVQTNYAPGSQQPTNLKVHYDPSRSLQTAAPLQPIEQLHFYRSERLKLHLDGAVTQEWSWTFKGPCSHRSERAKPCQDSTVIRERSNANVKAEKKLRTSSVAIKERVVKLDLPSPVVKEPNKQVGLAELHQDSVTNSKRSKMNKNDVAHRVELLRETVYSLPVERGWRAEEVAETTQRDVELVDVGRLEAMTEKRDSELIVEEREPCSENRDTEVNPTRLRRVPDLKNNQTRCFVNEKVSK